MFQIDLSPTGELLLYLPTGRALEIQASPAGVGYILRVLREHKKGLRDQPGYIKQFPTQHVIDKWVKENKVKVMEERASKLGIDLNKLEINI